MKTCFESRGYRELKSGEVEDWISMPNGTFSFRFNVPVKQGDEDKQVNIHVDAAIMRKDAKKGDFPALFEARSAGDFTNTNYTTEVQALLNGG